MLKSICRSLWSLVLFALLPVSLAAQGFVYTNNNTANNTISVFGFGADGTPSEVSGSPITTGGMGSSGGFYSANRIIVVGDFLYASNSGDNTISAFSNVGTGSLMSVDGSPFSTGAMGGQSGISLAATPDGQLLYAGTPGFDSQGNLGPITAFSIDATTGALTKVDNFSVSVGGSMSGMKVSPDGNYLAVAVPGASQLDLIPIRGPGKLHLAHNSQYVLSSGAATSVDFNCAGNLLFAGGANGVIYVFNIAHGKLSPVAGSPFVTTGTTTNKVVALSKDDAKLFASDTSGSTVTAFPVGTDGSLDLAHSANADPAGTTGATAIPGGLAVSNDGNFLFSADTNFDAGGTTAGISSFSVGGASLISFAHLVSTGQPAGLQSLAVYPAKTCTGSATAAVVPGR